MRIKDGSAIFPRKKKSEGFTGYLTQYGVMTKEIWFVETAIYCRVQTRFFFYFTIVRTSGINLFCFVVFFFCFFPRTVDRIKMNVLRGIIIW